MKRICIPTKKMVLGSATIKLMIISRIVPLEMSDNILLKMKGYTKGEQLPSYDGKKQILRGTT